MVTLVVDVLRFMCVVARDQAVLMNKMYEKIQNGCGCTCTHTYGASDLCMYALHVTTILCVYQVTIVAGCTTVYLWIGARFCQWKKQIELNFTGYEEASAGFSAILTRIKSLCLGEHAEVHLAYILCA